MRVKWLKTALAHLQELPTWIEEDFVAAAGDSVAPKVRSVISAIEQLAENPAAPHGRAGRIAGTRECGVYFDHYTVIYRVQSGVFQVLGILPHVPR